MGDLKSFDTKVLNCKWWSCTTIVFCSICLS